RPACGPAPRDRGSATAGLRRRARGRSMGSRRSSSLSLLFGRARWLGRRCRGRCRQPRQHFLGKQPDALLGLLMIEEARAPDKDEMAEAAHLLVDVHDLLVDGIRIAGAEDAAGDRLLGGDADQALARASSGLAPGPRLGPIILRGDFRR